MNLMLPLPGMLFWFSGLVSASVLLWAARTAPWRKLMARDERQHLWYGAILVLGVVWAIMGFSVRDIFRLHPMLVTVLTLVFGFRLAVLCGALALLLSLLLGSGAWQAGPFAWLTTVVFPAALTYQLLWLVSKTRVQNLFLYTLGVGFVGGLLTPLSIASSTLLLFWIFPPQYFNEVLDNFYLILLFTFPEGFLNGMLTSSLAVMAPHLVKTYDDDFYLR